MNEISMTLPFDPTPKGRPRFSVHYNHVQTHTPPKTKAFESQIAFFYRSEGGLKYDKGIPLRVSITFYMPIPKSASKKAKIDMQADIKKHTCKPDLDNLTKAVLDGLNEVAWYDDAQIVQLEVQKKYSGKPYIHITISELT